MQQVSNEEIRKKVEEIILSVRGYLFKKPENEDVVILLTGGIDSSVLADMFIEWSKVNKCYPLYIRRSAKAEPYESKAAAAVASYLANKYPNKVAPIEEISVEIPPKKFKSRMNKGKVIKGGYKVRNAVLINYGVFYASMLNDLGSHVHTIMIGKVSSDFFSGSRKEDLRMIMGQVCINTEDWRWQIISPAFESEFTLSFGKMDNLSKTDLVSFAINRNFPLQLTRSCTSDSELPCGVCEECRERLEVFHILNINDPIEYSKTT